MTELNLQTEGALSYLSDFLKNSIHEAGFDRALVGLSGGVDSSLSVTLAVNALGASNVKGLILPYKSSHPDSSVHARMMADRLGIEWTEIDISPQVDLYYEKYPEADHIRRGNKMARERMSILFDHSAAFNGLVVGTSNKSELLIGYSTLFGDSAAAFLPLGDLYKTQIFEFARHLGVPEDIIKKKPTADLWKDQSDEQEIGISYRELDEILYLLVDRRMKVDDILAQEVVQAKHGGFEFGIGNQQIGYYELVPDPHKGHQENRDDPRRGQGHGDPEERANRRAALDQGSFFHFDRDRIEKAFHDPHADR